MYVNVVFVIRCLYSAVSLTLVKEQRFIRIIYYCNYYTLQTEIIHDMYGVCVCVCVCARVHMRAQNSLYGQKFARYNYFNYLID